MIEIPIDITTMDGYNQFIRCKTLPRYEVKGRTIITDEASYAYVFGGGDIKSLRVSQPGLFDYQEHITNLALARRRYAAFASPGLGKTRIDLAFAKELSQEGKVLIQCPRMVIREFENDAAAMDIPISNLRSGSWNEKIGIMNYEARRPMDMRGVIGHITDESGILKSGDGETCEYLQNQAASVPYRLATSATPSPNDQSEYASHAVYLGYAATLKEFYSKYFVKDGNEWVLKGHADAAFYDHLASWAIYLQSPSRLGFQRGGELDHEPEYIEIPTHDPEFVAAGNLFAGQISVSDGRRIFTDLRANPKTNRAKAAIEAARTCKGQKIVWCLRNQEEEMFHKALPGSALLTGATKEEKRFEIIDAFRRGEISTIISKPKVLGFGVNLPQAEAHIYSGYDWSFEAFYQAVRRSHRYGRKGRLKVYIPLSNAEEPIWETLKDKLKTFDKDCQELQARFFKVAA